MFYPRTQGRWHRHNDARVRLVLAQLCAAIASMLCVLVIAAGPAVAAVVTATTHAPIGVTAQSAVLEGIYSITSATPGYTGYFEYGTTTGYGQQTAQSPLTSDSTSALATSVASLTPGTVYHFQFVVVAPDSTQTLGGDQSFTTSPPPSPPIVAISPPTISQGSVTLNGTVNPNGGSISAEYWQYGPTTSYGQQTPADGGVGALSLPAGTYHAQLVATDAAGTSVSPDETFAVIGTPTIVTGPVTAVTPTGFTVTATINPEGNQTVDYGLSYAPVSSTQGLGCDNLLSYYIEHFVCYRQLEGIDDPSNQVLTGGGFAAQTVTLAVPFGFNDAPRVRQAPTTRWIRATADVTMMYEAVIASADGAGVGGPGQTMNGGGIMSVTSPKSTAQAAVSTGRATYTPANPTERGCGNAHSYAVVNLHGTYTTADSPTVMFEIGPTSRLGHYDSFTYGTNAPEGGTLDALVGPLPATGQVELPLTVADRCPGPRYGDNPVEQVHPGEILHYRLVADDGFGPGPALGRERTFQVPRSTRR